MMQATEPRHGNDLGARRYFRLFPGSRSFFVEAKMRPVLVIIVTCPAFLSQR